MKCFAVKTEAVSPFNETQGLAVVGEPCRVAFIRRLLRLCRPSAVSRFVMTVYVYAVDRVVCGWTLAHVAQKLSEISSPLVADRDATSTIEIVFGIRWIKAAAFHVAPNAVMRVICHAVRRFRRTPYVSSEATTRAYGASYEFLLGHLFLAPAFASAQPSRCGVGRPWKRPNQCQTTDYVANYNARFSHRCILPQGLSYGQ